MNKALNKLKQENLIILLICALLFFIRLGGAEVQPEEAENALASSAIVKGGFFENFAGLIESTNPAQYLRALPLAISDDTFSMRFVNALMGSITVFLFYLIGKRFLNWENALGAAVLIAVSLSFNSIARSADESMPLLFFLTGAIYFAFFDSNRNKILRFSVALLFIILFGMQFSFVEFREEFYPLSALFYYPVMLIISAPVMILIIPFIISLFGRDFRNKFVGNFGDGRAKFLSIDLTILIYIVLSVVSIIIPDLLLLMIIPGIYSVFMFIEVLESSQNTNKRISAVLLAFLTLPLSVFPTLMQGFLLLIFNGIFSVGGIITLLLIILIPATPLLIKKEINFSPNFLTNSVLILSVILMARLGWNNYSAESAEYTGALAVAKSISEMDADYYYYLYNEGSDSGNMNAQLDWYMIKLGLEIDPLNVIRAEMPAGRLSYKAVRDADNFPDIPVVYFYRQFNIIGDELVRELKQTRPLLLQEGNYIIFGKKRKDVQEKTVASVIY